MNSIWTWNPSGCWHEMLELAWNWTSIDKNILKEIPNWALKIEAFLYWKWELWKWPESVTKEELNDYLENKSKN